MAVTDFDYITTRNKLIERAFRIVGVLRPGQTLSAGKQAQGEQALQSLIKFWQTDSEFIWTIKQQTVNLVAGTASYALGTDPKVIGVDAAWRVEGTVDMPVRVISWRDYNAIPEKTATGDVVQVAINNQSSPTLYVYNTPLNNGTLKLLVLTTVKDLDSAGDLGDFPPYWEEALTYGLADSLCDEYSIPLSEKDRITRKAQGAYTAARRFAPDRADDDFIESAF